MTGPRPVARSRIGGVSRIELTVRSPRRQERLTSEGCPREPPHGCAPVGSSPDVRESSTDEGNRSRTSDSRDKPSDEDRLNVLRQRLGNEEQGEDDGRYEVDMGASVNFGERREEEWCSLDHEWVS